MMRAKHGSLTAKPYDVMEFEIADHYIFLGTRVATLLLPLVDIKGEST